MNDIEFRRLVGELEQLIQLLLKQPTPKLLIARQEFSFLQNHINQELQQRNRQKGN